MRILRYGLAAVAATALAAGGFTASQELGPAETITATTTIATKGCNDWPGTFSDGECAAAGATITALQNIQSAVQFCKWKFANPGEWARLVSYAATGTHSTSILTWLGGSIQNSLEAYFGTHAPGFPLPVSPLPANACGGKLLTPPTIQGVTPGQTDVTVTVGS